MPIGTSFVLILWELKKGLKLIIVWNDSLPIATTIVVILAARALRIAFNVSVRLLLFPSVNMIAKLRACNKDECNDTLILFCTMGAYYLCGTGADEFSHPGKKNDKQLHVSLWLMQNRCTLRIFFKIHSRNLITWAFSLLPYETRRLVTFDKHCVKCC